MAVQCRFSRSLEAALHPPASTDDQDADTARSSSAGHIADRRAASISEDGRGGHVTEEGGGGLSREIEGQEQEGEQ